MVLVAARARICNPGINDISLAADAVVARRACVGDADHAVAEVASALCAVEVAADGDDFTAVGVGVSAGARAAGLVVDGCYAVVAWDCECCEG